MANVRAKISTALCYQIALCLRTLVAVNWKQKRIFEIRSHRMHTVLLQYCRNIEVVFGLFCNASFIENRGNKKHKRKTLLNVAVSHII